MRARSTFEILRPVPIAPLEVATTLLRGGRSVEVVGASLGSGGTEVMRATGVRVRTTDLPLGPGGLGGPAAVPGGPGEPPTDRGLVPAGPEHGEPLRFFSTGEEVGYHTAMEWRFVGLPPGGPHDRGADRRGPGRIGPLRPRRPGRPRSPEPLRGRAPLTSIGEIITEKCPHPPSQVAAEPLLHDLAILVARNDDDPLGREVERDSGRPLLPDGDPAGGPSGRSVGQRVEHARFE